MIKDFAVFPLFSIPIYTSFVDVSNSEIDFIANSSFHRMGNSEGSISNNKFLLDDLNLMSLKTRVQNHINFFLKQYLHLDTHYKLEIKKSWGVKHYEGDFAPKHDHANSLFSGILYLKCDDISGDITFYKEANHCNLFPPMLTPKFNEYNMINSYEWKWTPGKNQLFLFPSHLTHGVSESKSKDERLCLAFNIMVHGNYGNNDQTDSQGYINL